MDITSGLRLANTSSDVATFSERNAATSEDPAGPANSLGTLLNNVEHFRHHRSDDEKLSSEKREAALVQLTGVRPYCEQRRIRTHGRGECDRSRVPQYIFWESGPGAPHSRGHSQYHPLCRHVSFACPSMPHALRSERIDGGESPDNSMPTSSLLFVTDSRRCITQGRRQ